MNRTSVIVEVIERLSNRCTNATDGVRAIGQEDGQVV